MDLRLVRRGLLVLLAGIAVAGGGSSFTTLEAGAVRILQQEIPINIVFVGYEQGAGDQEIDQSAFLGQLPDAYRPVNRAAGFYGILEELPLAYTYKYNTVYANQAYEDAFFGYLKSIAVNKPITLFQDLYNSQTAATATITDNYHIDAPSVEHWLVANAPAGVDTKQYTVYLINWHGRADFVNHVYAKSGEPDPDTGHDFGEDALGVHKLIAWGGTAPDDEETGSGVLGRVWFYDLSAGPEAWTANWNLDNGDLDGDGVTDYRMPPVWEYGNSGYRAFNNLSADLGMVVRYVAINMLFTSSPVYNPALSAPRLPTDIEIDISVYQADPGADGNDWIDKAYLLAEIAEIQPYNNFTAECTDVRWSKRAADVYDCAMTFFGPDWDSCFGNRYFGVPLADLYLYHTDHLLQFLEGDADYEIATICYNLSEDMFQPFLGLADDNWSDGGQSYVYALDSPGARAAGYGFTATIIHEVGHHLGLSHPHDGYDWEDGVDYFQSGPFFFGWSGDECNSMMSYIDLNWDFSQFDRDNMNRFMTATYINMANQILAKICKSPRANKVSGMLESADDDATTALDQFDNYDWASAVESAKSAYDTLLAAAAKINVKIEPQARSADLKARGKSYHLINPIRTSHAK